MIKYIGIDLRIIIIIIKEYLVVNRDNIKKYMVNIRMIIKY
jgi:hypothetical protein